MYLTGFADEAAVDLAGQIKATRALGWNAIESRSVDGVNLHDLPEAQFEQVCAQLADAGIYVNCFGSTIANWGKRIEDPFELTLEPLERAIPRMQRLGTKLIRIMSYAPRVEEDQMAEERFRRLREITGRLLDAGLTPVHENCMNFGGMSWRHTLDMVEAVPGLKLVFDTGNPVITKDRLKGAERYQDPWEFYQNVKPHISYVHIKDVVMTQGREDYRFPNQGDARVLDILQDLKETGYDGGISIEPHMATVFHDPDAGRAGEDESYDVYVSYGQQLMALLENIDYQWTSFR